MKRTLAIALIVFAGCFSGIALAQEFTTDFRLRDCKFKSTGSNPYFSLRPGYRLIFEAEEDGETERLVITVLHETVGIFVPDVGVVRTRVVEERESVDGELIEVSRNFFAICSPTNDVFYFGEDVDIYHEDGSITHDGAWRAGQPDGNGLAKPGIIMPGRFLLGSRYFQEQADGIAEDRAEHIEMGLDVTTPAGSFRDCVRVRETSPLDGVGVSIKTYCPNVGLVNDGDLELVRYSPRDRDDEDDD